MNEKTAMITIAGRPNVGKSTLINALVGEKIAIVSHKPQTTRSRIYGIVNRDETQFVFLDTPGFHKPRTRLGSYMVDVVKESVADVDAVMLLVEPIANPGPQELGLIEQLKAADIPAILVTSGMFAGCGCGAASPSAAWTRCWRQRSPSGPCAGRTSSPFCCGSAGRTRTSPAPSSGAASASRK